MPSVFLCGASGSGKTTLANLLVADAPEILGGYARIKEVAREIMQRGLAPRPDPKDPGSFLRFQSAVVKMQLEREREYREKCVLSDRCVIDALVFVRFYLDEVHAQRWLAELKMAFDEAISRYRQSLVVLVNPIAGCEQDGVRLSLSRGESEKFTQIFRSTLTGFSIPFLDLTCTDLKTRQDTVISAVNGQIGYPGGVLSVASVDSLHFSHFLVGKPGQVRCFKFSKTNYSQWFENRPPSGVAANVLQKFPNDLQQLMMVVFERGLPWGTPEAVSRSGFTVNGCFYNYIPGSSAEPRNGDQSCYFFQGSKLEIRAFLERGMGPQLEILIFKT